jgi:hypothetical protein
MRFETWEKKCREWKEQHPDLRLPSTLAFHYSDPHGNFIRRMERVFDELYNYGIGNLEYLPQPQKEKALAMLSGTVIYLLDQLKQMGGEDGVKAILKRAGVIK